ncbi:hypothetical protein MHBO_001266 [Bonamia ostreae]|uniref:Tyrosine-protein kinase ephrin type A/B receptor-like domain-containing protein n=1 Tax=Bonamia ostreae TaxID=126728 RepID=A0ABV2AIC3_9EUKA
MLCPPGNYADANLSACLPCKQHLFLNVTSGNCEECLENKFPNEDNTDCIIVCPDQYWPNLDAWQCLKKPLIRLTWWQHITIAWLALATIVLLGIFIFWNYPFYESVDLPFAPDEDFSDYYTDVEIKNVEVFLNEQDILVVED